MLPLVLLICIPILSAWKSRSWSIWIVLSIIWSLHPLQQLLSNQQGHVYWQTRQTHSIDESKSLFGSSSSGKSSCVYLYKQPQYRKRSGWFGCGYHYYLDAPVRIDNVFGATRFEQLLWENTVTDIKYSLHRDNISHIIINWRFFLQNNNADYLEDGASIVIQERFTALIQMKILRPVRQWGPIWIYELEESSSDN